MAGRNDKTIRNLEPENWKKFKILCVKEETTISDKLNAMIAKAVKKID